MSVFCLSIRRCCDSYVATLHALCCTALSCIVTILCAVRLNEMERKLDFFVQTSAFSAKTHYARDSCLVTNCYERTFQSVGRLVKWSVHGSKLIFFWGKAKLNSSINVLRSPMCDVISVIISAHSNFLCQANLYNEVEWECVLCKFWENCLRSSICYCWRNWNKNSLFCYCVSKIPHEQIYYLFFPEKMPPRVFSLKKMSKFEQILYIYLNNKILDYRKKLGMIFFGA